jgi:nucleoside-diphosphate kinase
VYLGEIGKMEEEKGKERSFLMIKPGSVERGLVGEIVGRFEQKGMKILALKLSKPNKELMEKHYEEHRGKDFFEGLVAYMTSGLAVSFLIEGKNAIAVARKISGATDPKEAIPGTIRGDYGIDIRRNVIHASDSEAAAKREIALHFPELSVN